MELYCYEYGRQWLTATGVPVGAPSAAVLPGLWRESFALPADSGRKTALARLLIGLLPEAADAGFLLEEASVWPSSEMPLLFVTYRTAVTGQAASLDDLPFQVAAPDERRYLEGLVALSLYFAWGATLAGARGELVFEMSHDGYLTVTATGPALFGEAADALRAFGLRPLP